MTNEDRNSEFNAYVYQFNRPEPDVYQHQQR